MRLALGEYARAAGLTDRRVQARVDTANRLILGREDPVAPDAIDQAYALEHVDDGGLQIAQVERAARPPLRIGFLREELGRRRRR